MKAKKLLATVILLAVTGAFGGCDSVTSVTGSSETKDETADGNISQAIVLVEDYLKEANPSATVSESSFNAVETEVRKGSSETVTTDWVRGSYNDGGSRTVLVNIKSGDIYTDENWDKVDQYCTGLADKLYGAGNSDIEIAVIGTLRSPYFADTEKLGQISIVNMLPAGMSADEANIKELLTKGDYQFKYVIVISDEVDMKLFKETDFSSLGSNASIHVEMYPKADYDSVLAHNDLDSYILYEPVEIYDSELPGN